MELEGNLLNRKESLRRVNLEGSGFQGKVTLKEKCNSSESGTSLKVDIGHSGEVQFKEDWNEEEIELKEKGDGLG